MCNSKFMQTLLATQCSLHWVACKVNELRRGSCKLRFMQTLLATHAVYTSINIRKFKFIAYIYIRLSKNLDAKSYLSAKIEAVKQSHAVFLLTAEQRQ